MHRKACLGSGARAGTCSLYRVCRSKQEWARQQVSNLAVPTRVSGVCSGQEAGASRQRSPESAGAKKAKRC